MASLFFSVIGGTSVQRDVRTFWRPAGPVGQTVDLLSERCHVMHRFGLMADLRGRIAAVARQGEHVWQIDEGDQRTVDGDETGQEVHARRLRDARGARLLDRRA